MHDFQLHEEMRAQLLRLHPWLRLDEELTLDALCGVLQSPIPHVVEGLVTSPQGLWVRVFEDWLSTEGQRARFRTVRDYHTDPALAQTLTQFPGPEVYIEALVGLERTFEQFRKDVRRLRATLCPTRSDHLRHLFRMDQMP